MKIIKELKRAKQEKYGASIRYIYPIKVNGYNLSIQASFNHYCEPRETLNKLDLYSRYELAILNHVGEFYNLNNDDTLKKFDRWTELLERVDGNINSDCVVFGYVPIDLLNDLYLYLESI